MKNDLFGKVLVYSTTNYSLMGLWNNENMSEITMSAYDSQKDVIYGTYHVGVNLTSMAIGLLAIDPDTGMTVAKSEKLTWTDDYNHHGVVAILGVLPNSKIYVKIANGDDNSASLVSYNLQPSTQNTTPSSVGIPYLPIIAISVGAAIIIVGAYVYWSHRKHKNSEQEEIDEKEKP